jgi:hypothetical protein
MGWRSSHGARRDTNGPVRIEVQPADELSKPNAEDMDTRKESQAATGRPFKKGNRAAVGRRPVLARLGIPRKDLDYKNPQYETYIRYAEGYRQRRVSEMRIAHGFVSVGAMSIMATGALQLAMSRLMMDRAMQTDDMELLKKASGLANDGRQNELAAWELASREASAKTRAAASATPWLAHKNPQVRVDGTQNQPQEDQSWLVDPSPPLKKAHISAHGQEKSSGNIPQGS